MTNPDFDVLLLGTDINAYYMARNFHEAYGFTVNLLGKVPMRFTSSSKICNVLLEPDLWNHDVFKKRLKIYGQQANKRVVLVATNETYVRMVVENERFLKQWFVFNYPDLVLLNNLILKENFYATFGNSPLINVPQTYAYRCNFDELDHARVQALGFPLIVKPADTVRWYECDFATRAKVYRPENMAELQKVIHDAQAAGYCGSLILQQYIAGNDTHLFDCVFYVSSQGEVQLQTFAQIGLQEPAPTEIGSCTVLVNGYNRFGNTDEIKDLLKEFLVTTGYRGICEFDLKYDPIRKKFFVFEINPRQPRCGYYVTACGYNLAKYLVDDLIYNVRKEFVFVQEEFALSFVPLRVVKNYIQDVEYIEKVFDLHKRGKLTRVFDYVNDNGLKRRLWLHKRDMLANKKYQQYRWQ